MATAAKKEEVNPFLVVLLILAVAVAIGGGLGHGGGGRYGKGGGSNAKDPCEGKDAEHIVESWGASNGKTVRLQCGPDTSGNPGGYKHIQARHMGKSTDWKNVAECIGRTLTRGSHKDEPSGIGVQRIYSWTYETGKVATVRVLARTGNVITAFPDGSWTKCAGR